MQLIGVLAKVMLAAGMGLPLPPSQQAGAPAPLMQRRRRRLSLRERERIQFPERIENKLQRRLRRKRELGMAGSF